MTSSFFCRGWSDLDKISVTGDMSTAVMWSKSKPDVQLIWRTFRRIQRHVIPEPPAIMQVAATCEFNVMIPELRVTLQGAATGRIQWHVIPEPPATLQVLPPGEFSIMIPELRVTLQGAATKRIKWHVIPEPCITLQGAATW